MKQYLYKGGSLNQIWHWKTEEDRIIGLVSMINFVYLFSYLFK